MTHIAAHATFKLNSISGLTAAVSRAIKVKENSKVDLDNVSSLLGAVLKRLENYPFAMVRSESFSLVNISTSLGKSFGYSEVDFSKQRSLPSNMVFLTFAVIPSPSKKIIPSKQIDLIGNDFMFGSSRSQISYLVITLDQTEKRDGINYQMLKHLEFLYNIIGLTSKSFVTNPRGWWDSNVYSTRYPRVMYDRYYSCPLERLLKEEPIGYWIYNKNIWHNYPHLVLPRLIDENFYKYFVLFLLDTIYVGENLSESAFNWIYGSGETLATFVSSGIKKLLIDTKSSMQLQLETRPIERDGFDDSLYCVLHLLYRYVEPEGIGLDDDLASRVYVNLMKKISLSENSEFVRDQFYKLCASPDKAAYDLIDRNPAFERIAEMLFGDLS